MTNEEKVIDFNIETEFKVVPQSSDVFVEVAMEIEDRAKRLAKMTGNNASEILTIMSKVLEQEEGK